MRDFMESRPYPENAQPLSFWDKERLSEQHLLDTRQRFGDFWHICTPGSASEVLFVEDVDYKFAISNMAISAAESGVVILTDSIMSNHIHVLAAGARAQCLQFIDCFRYRLNKYNNSIGRYLSLCEFRCDAPISVDNLESVRNEIAYINRNGYLVNPSYTPFSYPWGSGYLYFNQMAVDPRGIPYEDAPYTEKRRLCKRRLLHLPERYRYHHGMILPQSYARTGLGERMFRDAHHYFNTLARNLEAYSEEAKRLGDTIILTDEELYPATRMLSEKQYGVKQPALLKPTEKFDLAMVMKRDYHATPAQVKRILKLPTDMMEQLYPSFYRTRGV